MSVIDGHITGIESHPSRDRDNNTEEQQELSSVFGVQSIPSLLFIPKEGQPQMAMGALPKETFKQAISEVLSVNE